MALASGGYYGHTVGKAIGYGYVRRTEGVDAEFVMSSPATTRLRSPASGPQQSPSWTRPLYASFMSSM